MKRKPLIDIRKGAWIDNIQFPSGEPFPKYDHTEGYWLLFRKPVYKLHEDFVITFMVDGIRYKIVMKAGFYTDLASTPKAIWWIFPPFDTWWARPTVGHDGFYAGELFPRWFCDAFMRGGMKVCNCPWKIRWTFHHFVRNWGWLVWRGHTDASIAASRALIEVWKDDILVTA